MCLSAHRYRRVLWPACLLAVPGCQYGWPVAAPAVAGPAARPPAAAEPARSSDPRLARFDALGRAIERQLERIEARIVATPAAEWARAERLLVVIELRVLDERREQADLGLPSECPDRATLKRLAQGRIDRARRRRRRRRGLASVGTTETSGKLDTAGAPVEFGAEASVIDRLAQAHGQVGTRCAPDAECDRIKQDEAEPSPPLAKKKLTEGRDDDSGADDKPSDGPGGVGAARVEHAAAPAGVMRQVRLRRSALRRCLPLELTDAGLSLTVIGRIDSGGAFRQPAVLGAVLDPQVEGCIADVFRAIRLPAYRGASRVVRVPLWFGGAE